MDDADQELESGSAKVCDRLRRSFTVRSVDHTLSLIVMNSVYPKILTRSSIKHISLREHYEQPKAGVRLAQ